MAAELSVGGDVLVVDRLCLALESLAQPVHRRSTMLAVDAAHALDRPSEIHGRRAGVEQRAAHALEAGVGVSLGKPTGAERNAHGRGHADRRCAAHHHVADGARHLAGVAVDAIDFATGKQPLIDHHDAPAPPFDRSDHDQAASRSGVRPYSTSVSRVE